MGCVKSASHTSSNPLPPSSVNKTTNFGSSVPFNKNLTLISSHQAFQPDPGYVESRRKKFAEFAMHFRIESVVNIINQSIPFESVTELDLSMIFTYRIREVLSTLS